MQNNKNTEAFKEKSCVLRSCCNEVLNQLPGELNESRWGLQTP